MSGEKRGATRVVTVVRRVVDAATGRLDRVASVALVFIFIGLSALGFWIHGTTSGHAADAADYAVDGALYQQARFDLAVELADHREQGTEPRTPDTELRMAAVHLQRTMRDLGRSGTASDVAVVQTVLSLNRALLSLSSHYRVDLATGRRTAARRLDDSRIDPLFATMQQKLNHISASNQHQGLAELDQLLHEQDTVQNVIELGGGIGLLLAGLLVAVLAGYRRRLEDEANALRESEASFRILFADNPLPMWVFDRVSLAFIEVNDAAVAKYGYSRQQFLSMTIADIRPKEDTDLLRADVDAHPVAVSHGDGWRHTLADGAVIDVDVTTHSVPFADRPATLVVARDITMKKQASREIAEALARTEAAENQYRTLVEQLPAVVYRTEADGLDTTTYTSPVIKDLIGYSAEEVSGTLDAWLAFIHPDDRERVRADNAAGSAAADPIALEYRVIARDESVRWVRDEAVLVQDASGTPLYWQGLLQDITEQKRAIEALEQSEARVRGLIASNLMGVIVARTDGRILEANDAFLDIIGYSRNDLDGGLMDWASLTPPEYHDITSEVARQLDVAGTAGPFEKEYVRKDGTRVPVLFGIALIESTHEALTFVVDLRAQKAAERARRESDAQFRAIFDQAAVGVTLISPELTVIETNAASQRMLGYTADELRSMKYEDITHPDDVSRQFELYRQVLAGDVESGEFEKRYIRKEGGVLWGRISLAVIRHEDGTVRYIVSLMEDITEEKRIEAELRYQSLHDVLTGLPNRTLLVDSLSELLPTTVAAGRPVALAIIGLSGFKEINDTFGHAVGDQALKHAAACLQRIARDSDVLARIGGDEFALVLPGDDEAAASELVHALHRALSEPFQFEGGRLQIAAAAGIAVGPGASMTSGELIRRADVALVAAQTTRQGLAVYREEQDTRSPDRAMLAADLRDAIDKDELVLHFQPKIDARTGALTSVEALVRWYHPQRGMIPPSVFIEIAEHTGLIKLLTLRVLDSALRQARAWYDAGMTVKVAVNLSAQSLYDPDLDVLIAQRIRRWAASGDWLILEITETDVMTSPESARVLLEKLRAMGIEISIDDFGTGYSSLSYLKRLPVSEVKIDRSFVTGMVDDANNTAIVRSIVELGHSLGLRVVAEGAEDDETVELLRMLGCDRIQGYVISRPVSALELTKWAQGHGSASHGVGAARPHSSRILVVDDNRTYLKLVRALLTSEGMEVATATDAAGALEDVALHDSALILVDVHLGKGDGLALAREVLAARPIGGPPIVALTAALTEETVVRAHAAGCVQCIAKPASLRDLVDLVRSYVSAEAAA